MKGLVFLISGVLAAEGFAWWWMNPPPEGDGGPVLVWREPESGEGFRVTARPDSYARSAPMLRCSSGGVWTVEPDEGAPMFLAFFSWDATETGAMLEGFKHMPEECLGAAGLRLLRIEKPKELELEDGTRLVFDHTVFRHGAASGPHPELDPQIHAFKAVWLSTDGTSRLRDGLFGAGQKDLREIRWRAALSRFRPASTRVVQGAVHGAADGDDAWRKFAAQLDGRVSLNRASE